MLSEMIRDGYGLDKGLVCSETLLHGANEVYQLGLDQKALKLSSALGGGMYTGRTCGAVISSLMIIGYLNTETFARQSPEMMQKVASFQKEVIDELGSLDCNELKEKYWDEAVGCRKVYIAVAELLEDFLENK